MPNVELVYSSDCPNVPHAREQLRLALAQTGLPQSWQEYSVDAPDAPEYVRSCGSPTILVDGVDVDSTPSANGTCCRVYSGSERRGAPRLRDIVAALQSKVNGSP